MHSDKHRPLISSETQELSNEELAPGGGGSLGSGKVKARKFGAGGSFPRPAGEPSMSQSQQDRDGQAGLGPEFEVEDNGGLGKPSLLGKDIIPPSPLASPHPKCHLQPPALRGSVPIKTATRSPSRAASASGDLESPALPVNHTPPSTMIFSDLYKSPKTTFTKIRNSFPHGIPPPPDLDADLVSRDKARNKEAVKKYLDDKVRNDWDFTWPPMVDSPPAPAVHSADEETPRDLGEEADSESDAESVYSTISEDPLHFRPRAEWTSDLSDSDELHPPASPFRFDSPESVGAAVRNSAETKRTRRRRAVRDEMKWNPGLSCFEARRNAWTGAKTVRVKPKPPSPISPSSARRLFWRHHRTQSSVSHAGAIASPGSPPTPPSPLQHTATRTSTADGSESDSAGAQRTSLQEPAAPAVLYPVQTVLPVPPPLLPPQNPMRASVQPSMYGSLYDKVVVHNMQPSCPVNLADMLRACVVGWKRDGEWPPKPSYPAPAPVQTTNAEVLAARQRKAQQQRSKNATAATATNANAGGRRLSLVGFFNGGGAAGHRTAAVVTTTAAMAQEGAGDRKDSREGKENGHVPGHSQSHSDEGAGSSGKALFRRSLQKVLSLGQHGHAHGGAAANGTVGGNGAGASLSPTSPTTKELTAAG
ncbi:hypothetical protein N658DRAFT_496259 [Parathielavia hyrcaniae]|uniref:Gag1-like clamp domain-containing protein n=1 Tax=Parathielavia hyrcaniae TaxID=113614 RepID=A0AAN6Q5X2_9PEZI|nr:hypothetical protein N658DRAFT_496259 [Parathielavia hyrcaniae]